MSGHRTFDNDLGMLLASVLPHARRNPDFGALMIERLASGLALTIAAVAQGDPKAMATLLQGAEGYLYETAADHQNLGALLAKIAPPGRYRAEGET